MNTRPREQTATALVPDDATWAAVLFALALTVRFVFLAQLEIPPFDPWRHLALVRNQYGLPESRSLAAGFGFSLPHVGCL